VRTEQVLAATNGYTPRALQALRRRVVPIGSYQIATEPLDAGLIGQLMPHRRVFSDTKNLLYYFRLSPDARMVFGGRASYTPASARRSAKILRTGMRDVFPELAQANIEYAWSGKVAYPMDHLPHAGRHDGLHYAMGYCGLGHISRNENGRGYRRHRRAARSGHQGFPGHPVLFRGTLVPADHRRILPFPRLDQLI
jgi:glycine/D-amino acid oxidase-like deaminating enzyme